MSNRHVIDVHILITDPAGRLLLTQRAGNDEFAGRWHAPSGKVEYGESLTRAAVREAWEEVGVIIDPVDLRLVHIAHVADSGPDPRVGFFFHATRWSSEPRNREPTKCSAVEWFSPAEMTELDIIAYPAIGIEAYRTGASASFSEHGWRPAPTDPLAAAIIAARSYPHPDHETPSPQTFSAQPELPSTASPEPNPIS